MKKKSKSKQHSRRKTSSCFKDHLFTFLHVMGFLLPLPVYLLFTLFLFPVPNSGFLVLGCIGTGFIGLGLTSLVNLLEKQPFSHVITLIELGIGLSLIGVSSYILYSPSIYALFDEEYVTYYFIMWVFLTIPIIWYALFRSSMSASLHKRKISKTRIKELMQGNRNYWWYEALHREFGIGLTYSINKVFTIIYPFTVCLHILLGWWRPASLIIAILFCLSCLIISILWGVSAHLESTYEKNYSGTTAIVGILFPLVLCAAIASYILQLWNFK